MVSKDNGTRLSSDVTKPQPTKPGDAPADTKDWHERASSVTADKKAAASAGYQTVNAVVPTDPVPDTSSPPSQGRTETYVAYDGRNKPVTVTHDLDTGKTTVGAPTS
ncbi:hypothetical protein [Sciscionella sediminilitoris]|uniref:hypothetical protein n=1 Tax=Sciscionella sediminilitoris TaxID=1445613 RepID=UPI0004DFB5C1|nr:hypothetical protein [Sciscionella sp. SE31]